MVFFYVSRLAAILSVVAVIRNAVCTPFGVIEFSGLDSRAHRIIDRSKEVALSTVAPHFVIYSDKGSNTTGPPPPAQVKVRYI
jgi:hypothetical protein